MTDKVQKILNEIATRKLCTMDEHMAFYNDKAKEDYRFLSKIEELIKALQKEPESVWRDAKHQPKMFRKYLVRYSDGRVSGSWERHDDDFIPWKDVVKEHGFTHWCYVEDLLKL